MRAVHELMEDIKKFSKIITRSQRISHCLVNTVYRRRKNINGKGVGPGRTQGERETGKGTIIDGVLFSGQRLC